MEFGNPLDFPGYEDKVREAREKTRLNEANCHGKMSDQRGEDGSWSLRLQIFDEQHGPCGW